MNQPDVENRHADTVGRGEGEGATNWESSPETYTLPYVKQIGGILLQDAGSSNPALFGYSTVSVLCSDF